MERRPLPVRVVAADELGILKGKLDYIIEMLRMLIARRVDESTLNSHMQWRKVPMARS